MKQNRRRIDRDLRNLKREARRLDVNIRLLSATDSVARGRDYEPATMIRPGGVQTTGGLEIREEVDGTDTFAYGRSRPILPDGPGPMMGQRRPAAWVTYGLQQGPGMAMRVQRGPVTMLSRRHDRALNRSSRYERVSRNRLFFALVLLGMAGLTAYHFLFR